jgi:hypothetical protein
VNQVHELGTRGIRSLAIARQDNEDGRWRFLGIMTFLDPPRPDTRHTIEQANLFGVEVSWRQFALMCDSFRWRDGDVAWVVCAGEDDHGRPQDDCDRDGARAQHGDPDPGAPRPPGTLLLC